MRGGPPPWLRRRERRRRLFLRFVAVFGLIALLTAGAMAVVAWLLSRAYGGGQQMATLVWLAGCGLVLLLPILAAVVAGRAFRGIAAPLADIMDAANALAGGELAARVPVRGSPEFRQLARSFNRMAEELELSDQQRRDLMADVAHELRTPLQIIQGNLEGVLDGVYDPDQEHIAATLEETRRLARLVEDLRTLSLAEAGHLPMHQEAVDVAELLQDVSTSFSGQAEAKGVSLDVRVPEAPASLVVEGDAGRLDQVLGNLVANALRHTPAGGAITLSAAAADPGVRITVADTGTGIAPEELRHIFDRFWSRDSAGSSGGGLGLAIARSLVEAHGGQIEAASQPGEGTAFTISLPQSPLETDSLEPS